MSEWQALHDEVVSELSRVDTATAVAFAAITAERLMRLDLQRLPFTQGLRPLLDLVWRGAAGDSTAFKPIAMALGQFYISEYWHNDGPEGPNDADDDPAAAILYAAECYMHSDPMFATSVATRAMDAADYRVQLATEDEDGVYVDSDPAMVAEAHQQLATLAALAPLAQQLKLAQVLPAPERDGLLLQLQALVAVPPSGSTAPAAENY